MSTRHDSEMDLRFGLRISIEPVSAALIFLGVLLVAFNHLPPDPSSRFYLLLLGLSLYAVSTVAWRLDRQKAWASRGLVIAALVGIIYLVERKLHTPGLLTLMAIPTALAAALINLSAATIVAVGQTALLLLSVTPASADADPAAIVIALIAVWATLGVMVAVYYPIYCATHWWQEYYQRAQSLLEEAQGRRVELAQALEGLVNANRQLALANERTAALRAIAEEAQKSKTAFVASVSHELRTPLNMILGLVDLMVESPGIYDVVLSPRLQEDLRVVHRNCEHLSNMINDILDLTRMEAGHLTLHRERVDLREVIEASVEVVQPLLKKKGLALRVAIPDDLPDVYCDRARIRQVILNLVSNAVRFTEEGGIAIQVAREDEQVIVSVADTGPGILPEDRERIFEPFWQGSAQLWRGKGGSGLGLSISRQFVRLHGGRMWLETEPGVGTTFFFTLPISAPLEQTQSGFWIRDDWVWREPGFKLAQTAATDELVRMRVIVCDEFDALCSHFARYSDQIEFVDTRDLAQLVHALHECPAHAVVVNTASCDDLWPLIEVVRKEAATTPVIGCSVPWQAERAAKAGALGYLIKPVTRNKLKEAIEAVGRPVKRVLVVDDDLDVLRLFSQMLHVCDDTLEILTAASGTQALEMLRHTTPDLMLLDIIMPDVDGWEVLEHMHKDEDIEDVPTFLVSAQDPAERPPMSDFLLATVGGGLSLSRLLQGSLEMSRLLLQPEKGLDLTPE